ncbi:hypothetical protein POTOM_005686 [Populus tomentosa]|uniref:Ankyrin repeat family protein n=1 Tax=Populus tomentosa TaxID=118781 RepID=A0A8X8AMJ6_POPTO|nr:hypothetical protein POTOM_005686 [Populus tomentosa]
MGEGANQAEQQTQIETTPETVDALLEAARYDDIEDIASLASSGVSLDSKDSLGRTALHMAAANGHLDIVEYLISQGVYFGSMDMDHKGLEHVCLFFFLSVPGLDPDCKCFGKTYQILVTSIEQDLNSANKEKNTALHWACLNGHIEVVKKLILAGSSLGFLNSHERTPMDEAVTREKMDVIDAINAAVAQLELAGVAVS